MRKNKNTPQELWQVLLEDEKTGESKPMQDFLMELRLDRKLYPDEEVIFLNGNPFDFRGENLKVVKKGVRNEH